MSDEMKKAALDYVEKECSYESEHHALREVLKKTDMAHFIAGAKWQAERAKVLVQAIKTQHQEWGHNSEDCSPECTYLCKALAAYRGEK